MKCKCGNEIDIRMGSKLIAKGCRAQCEKCGAMFQVPIKSDGAIIKKD